MRPSAGVFCVAMIVAWAFFLEKSAQHPSTTLHDVKIVDRVDDYSFRGLVKDPETQEWMAFAYSGCHDYKLTKEIQKGVTLTELKYVESFEGSCNEIAPAEYGYMLKRDSNLKPIQENFDEIIATARQATSQTGTGWTPRAYAGTSPR